MKQPIKRAMVLAAGLGLRMRPVSETRPKPLVTVAGRTLLDHVLDRLIEAGVELIVVNIHYRAEMIREVLAKRREVEIRISDETDKLLDTGGGIAKALPHFEGEPFFTHNADSLWAEGMGQYACAHGSKPMIRSAWMRSCSWRPRSPRSAISAAAIS